MSALPPKADMCGALVHVCFGPKADIRAAPTHFTPESGHANRPVIDADQIGFLDEKKWDSLSQSLSCDIRIGQTELMREPSSFSSHSSAEQYGAQLMGRCLSKEGNMKPVSIVIAVAAVASVAVCSSSQAAPIAPISTAITTNTDNVAYMHNGHHYPYRWHGNYYRYHRYGHYYNHRYYRHGRYYYS